MPTIKDVAKKAGVSIATVSNILNNKASVGEETYRKVYDAIAELDYRPNLLARNLKSNGVKFIGIIVPTFFGIYKDILEGIQREFTDFDYYIIARTTDDIPIKERRAIDEFVNLGVCGIFIVTSFKDVSYYRKAADARIPLLFMERTVDELNYSSAVFDNRSLMKGLLRSLLEEGCAIEDIWLITGDTLYSSERDFREGARLALDQAGIAREALWTSCISFSDLQAFADLTELADGREKLPRHVLLTSERVLDSFQEMLSVHGLADVHIYVPTGDRWNTHNSDPHIHPVPRRAIYCGRRCARLMLEVIRKAAAYENTQIVIPTEPFPKRKIETAQALNRPCQERSRPLKLLLTDNAMSAAVCRLLPAFTRETGIRVEARVFAYQQELYEEIMEQHHRSSDEYDIYMMDSPWIEYFKQIRCVLSLNPYLENDKEFVNGFVEDIWDKINGGHRSVAGIPLVSMTQLLLYRKDLFSSPALQRAYYHENGLELALPATWTEYNVLARFFTRSKNAASPTQFGTCLQGKRPNGLIQEFFPRQWSFHGSIMDKDKVALATVQNVRAVQNLQEAYACSYPQIWDLMENEQITEFARGDIAFINTYSGHLKSILDTRFHSIGEDLGFAVLPGRYSLIGAWLLAVNAACKAPDIAFSFIKWITSGQRAVQCSVIGGFMPNRAVSENEQIKTIYPWNEKLQDYVKMERHRENIRNRMGSYINNYTVEEILAEGLQRVLKEECSAGEMLEDCQERIGAMVREWKGTI